MVAVVSGNSLGLSLGSMATLGQRGVLGQAGEGRGGDQVFVNAATGNLVVQRTDEYLASRGLDIALTRTYNSRGLADGDNGDNWRMGVYKTVTLTGNANKTGSTMTRVDGDGASAVYILNGNKEYISKAGEGAYDKIESRGKNWVWTDGTTGVKETYDSAGRLVSAADPDGNTTNYTYNAAGLVTRVEDASGGTVALDYDGNLLRQLTTTYTDAGGTRTQVRTHYKYDALNRLSEVVTDLTLGDGLAADDANTYWTQYAYEGASTRISHLSQKDGTRLDFTYREVDGAYRVSSVTDGEGRITVYDHRSALGTTWVIDPLGNVTKVIYDEAHQLKQVQAPTVGGVTQVTEYEYNANGDVIAAKDARGNTVTMAYDANGNQTEQKDAAGNTVSRIYSASNRLQIETLYTGSGKTGAALSTRYVYDNEDHLRFVVSPEGRVTEYTYFSNGERESEIRYSASAFDVSTLAPTAALDLGTLQDWCGAATTDRTAALRTDYAYDPLGQLSTATSYANLKANGTGILDNQQTVVTYVYGSSGRLLQAIDGNRKLSSFAYDGLDRLTASVDANNVTTHTVYDDAGNRTVVKLDDGNGLWTTSSYNRAGDLVNVTQSNAGAAPLGTSRYAYDAAGRLLMETDPTGRRSWHLYDDAGRKVADVDAVGGVVEYRYNANNQVVRTVRYAQAADVSRLVDAAGKPTGIDLAQVRPGSHPDDRSTWAVYDAAGRLVQTIDGEGNVAETTYDAASRVVQVKSFAKVVSLPLVDEPGAVTPETSPLLDRVARNFHDKDGNLVGALDGEGYLTVYNYDKAGQRVNSRAYATPTRQDKRAAGTLAELTPAEDNTKDVLQTQFFDRKGRLVGVVDGEGFLTEQVHDLGGNLVGKIRYADRVTAGGSLADIRPAASAAPKEWKQEWVYEYTALNQLASETSPDSTITRYVYDNVGNLIETTRGWQSGDARTATRRYDVQGRLVAELSGEGSVQLAQATTAAAVDAVWTHYANKYAYDAAGRRISTTDPLGHKTLHYYDARGRLAADINAEGEVEARNYDPLGDLSQTRRYAKRLDSVSGLAGGDLSSVAAVVNALADDGKDSLTTYVYDHNGRLARSRDALQFETRYSYNAFDEVERQREAIDASSSLVRDYAYDRRGLRTSTTSDPTAVNPGGLNIVETASYDAFGRLETTVDGNTHTTLREYDRLGRLVAVNRPIGRTQTFYDPFDRVTLEIDATLRETKTQYNTADRTVTVELPAGVTLVTQYDRHGDKVSVRDGNLNYTHYTYDKDGRLKSVEHQAKGSTTRVTLSKNDWDNAGNLKESWDANNVSTRYSYDAANRVLTQAVDPDGLNLVTRYGYDTAGRVLTQTVDPDGLNRVTTTEYDAKGQARAITVDEGGLRLVTKMTYDGRGRTLRVEDPDLRTTTYTYDVLGRRETETIAGLQTRYFYDNAGNLTTRKDAAGHITRYVYDGNDRQVYEINGAGGVTATSYDEAGRVTLTRQHVNAVSATWLDGLELGQVLQPKDVPGIPLSSGGGETPSSADLAQERILDDNGRVAFTIDAELGLTAYQYDANGNLTQSVAYANALDEDVAHTMDAIRAHLPELTSRDRVTINAYNSLNRLERQVERQGSNTGALTIFGYDAAGNLVQRDSIARPVTDIGQNPDPSATDRRERMVYDAAGRLIARATAQKPDGAHLLWSVEEFAYDRSGNVKEHRQHAQFLSTAGSSGDIAAWIKLLEDHDSDRVQRYEYDDAGRMTRKTAADGAVCDYAYDRAGNVVAKVEYATTAASRTDTNNRISRSVYDAAGRAIYEIDAEGAVTRRLYDGAGRVIKSIRYANPVALPASDGPAGLVGVYLDESTVAAALRPDAAHDRVEQNIFDSAGRLAYAIDAEGALRRNTYDGAGHLQTLTRFHPAIDNWSATRIADGMSKAAMDAEVQQALDAGTNQARTDLFDYNGQGLLESSTDALGFKESYSYDALGNKLKFTNKSGAIWDYEYDAASHLLREISPEVEIASAGTVLPSQRIETVLAYDALGNLLSRTEAANVAGQSRITTYEYDAVGRQVKTLYPRVDIDDGRGPRADDLERHETLNVQLFSETEYDALGNAIRGTDVGGAVSQKTYDRSGRVHTETDALLGVTVYARNAFGEVETLTRKARLAGESDRSITTGYDRMGRAIQVNQPLAAFSYDTRSGAADRQLSELGQVTWTEFDAFGQAIKVSVGGRDASGTSFTTGVTYHYYDRRGQRRGELAQLGGVDKTAQSGYLTTTSFDAEGNAVEVKDYAMLVAGEGISFADYEAVLGRAQSSDDDRTVRTEYDAMNRKRSETRVGRYLGTVVNGSVAVDELTTDYFYDALGNLTGSRDAAGAITSTVYDALGRKTAVLAPTRADIDERGTVTPLTEFKLDAYGNVVSRTDYAGGAQGVDYPFLSTNPAAVNYRKAVYATPVFDAARDRRALFTHDAHGHVRSESDALGTVTERSYDAYGHLARTWTPLSENGQAATQATFTVNRYDALGRVTDVITPGSSTVDTDGRVISTGNVTTEVEYNSFGEAVRQTVNELVVEHNDFDAAGRLWRTKGSDGVARLMIRDVDGRVTLEVTNPNHDLMAGLDYWADNRVTETVYDALGNAVARSEPNDVLQPTGSSQQVAFLKVEFDPTQQAKGTITYQDVSQSSDGTPNGRMWSGTNSVKLSWPSLADLGGSDVKVEVDYLSPAAQAGDIQFAAKAGSYSQVFEAWQVPTGATLTWQADQESRPGLEQVKHVRVSKKNNEGEWVELIARDGSSVYGIWVNTPAPSDPGQSADLWVKPLGSAAEYQKAGAMTRFGDRMLYRYEAIGSATNYDYQVRFGEAVADAGTFTFHSKVGEIAPDARPTIEGSGTSATVSWKAPAAGTLQRLRARLEPNGVWFDIFDQRVSLNASWVLVDGAMNRLQLTNLALGRYDYELLQYTGTGDETLAAHSNGTLTIGPLVTFGAAADAGLVAHGNVLTWAPPTDRAGAFDKIEVRSVSHSSEPPVYGEWEDLSAGITSFGGGMRGLSLDGRASGALEYLLTFRDPGLAGADYTEAGGVVHVMPTPQANLAGLQSTLTWTEPPGKLVLNGIYYTVQQVLTVVDKANGQPSDASRFVTSLGDGRNGLDFKALGQIDGVARAYDYTLEWRIAELGISLGTASGHLRFGPSHPAVSSTTDGQGLQLGWAVPLDLTGAPMQTQLYISIKGRGEWAAKPFQLATPDSAVFDLRDVEPAEYDYRIEYLGRETPGGELVSWAANQGSATAVPQPRFGAAPAGLPVQQGLLNHILSWRAPSAAYPVTATLVTTPRRGGAPTTEAIQPAVDGRQWVNFAGRPAGDYDYALTFTRPDGSVLGTATGVVRLVPEPALVPGSGTVLAWTAVQDAWPGVNVRQILEATPLGQESWIDFTHLAAYNAATGEYRTDLSGLPPSAWNYRLRFVDGASNELLGTATGTLVSLPPAHAGSVNGFAMPDATLSWMAPPDGFRAVVKLAQSTAPSPDFNALPEYTGAVATFSNPAVNPATQPYEARRHGVSLADLPAGDYAYQIEYFQIASGFSFGKLQGKLAAAPEAQLENIPRGTTFGGIPFAQDTPGLHWARPTEAQPFTASLVLRNAQGREFTPAVTHFDLAGQLRSGADLSSLPTGSYSYTLTFTGDTGEVLTSTGNFHHLNDAKVENGILSWDAPPAGVSTVLRYRDHDPSNTAPYQTWTADPHYDKVSLQLSFNSSDGSPSFVDSSASPKTPVTIAGNAMISAAQSKFGGGSLRLDGVGDYVSYASNPDFDLPGDFTIEFWVYLPAASFALDGAPPINRKYLLDAPTTGDWGTRIRSNGALDFYTTSNNQFTFATPFTADAWHHVAYVRRGSTMHAYLDGAQSINSFTITTNFTSSRSLDIGRWDTVGSNLTGYLDDIRITKDVARYSSNFTPSSSNFLNLPDSRQGIDTWTGDPYYDKVSLQADFNGADGSRTFTDTSASPTPLTANGDVQISTAQSKLGSASARFDGSGDYLSAPHSADFNLESGDFTVEAWIYRSASGAAHCVVGKRPPVADEGWGFTVKGDDKLIFYYTAGSQVMSAGSVPSGQWVHVAAVRSGTTFKLFINGVNDGTTHNVANGRSGTADLRVGKENDSTSDFNGYMDGLRVTKGAARYTDNFTPPIGTADPYYDKVSLLLPFNGSDGSPSFVDGSASSKTPVTIGGNAMISATQSKFGGGSLRLDGVGDYVSYASNPDFDLPGDFTIEFWVYLPAASLALDGAPPINRKYLLGAPTTGDWGTRIRSNGALDFYTTSNNQFTFATPFTADTWHHVAYVRRGSTMHAYLDGAQSINSFKISTNFTSSRSLDIGRWDTVGSNLTGYLDDIRITKDVARYSSNFTPPSSSSIRLPGSRQGIDLSSLPSPADYDYIVEFQDAAGNKLVSTQGEVRLQPQIAMGAIGPSVMSWETPPAGITQELRYKLAGAASFGAPIPGTDIPVLGAGRSGFDLKNTPAGEYDIEVVFKRGAEVWGTSTATVRVISQASFGNEGDSVLSWTTPSAGITASLQVWRNGVAVPVTPTVLGDGLRTGVDLASQTHGAYTYKLTFTKAGQTFGSTEGSFTISVPPTLAMDAQSSVVTFAENFDDGIANGAQLFPNQVGILGTWSVQNGYYEGTGGGAAFGDANWTDYDAELDLNFAGSADNDAAIAFRIQDSGNWYQFRVRNGLMRLLENYNGQVSELARSGHVPFVTGHWYQLKVEVRGTTVRAFLDGQQVLSSDAVRIQQGKVGMMQDGGSPVRYDNLRVATTGLLGTNVAWTTPPADATQVFAYQNLDAPTIQGRLAGNQIPALGSGLSGFDVGNLPPGRYAYTLTTTLAAGSSITDQGEYTIIPKPSVLDASVNNPKSFVSRQYIDILGRGGSASEIESLASTIASNSLTPAQAVKQLLDSSESQGSVAAIARMYFAALGRFPDYNGFQHHLGRLRSGTSLATIVADSVASPEFQSRNGVLTNAQFVDLLFQQALERAGTTSERDYWIAQLGQGVPRGQVMLAFSEGAEFKQHSANKVLVATLYLQLLRRTPDAQGFLQQLDRLTSGSPATDAIAAFLESTEYRLRLLRSFVSQQYIDILGRGGSASEIESLAGEIASNSLTPAQAVKQLLDSSESQGSVAAIARMYFAAHGRFPDYDGFQHHLGRLRSGTSLATIVAGSVASPEFQSRNGVLTNAQFVDLLFQQALERAGTTSERDYWIAQLNQGVSRGQIMLAFSEGAEFKQLSANKVLVATLYLQLLRRTPDTGGFHDYLQQLITGAAPVNTIASFLDSTAYQNRGVDLGIVRFSSGSGLVSWPRGAGGETAAVYYNDQPLPATLQDGVYSVDVSNLAPNNYDFKIVYFDEIGSYAQVNSTLSVVLAGDAAGVPQTKRFSLLSTQTRYFYRGSNPRWSLSSSSVSGENATATSQRATHIDWGSTGLLAGATAIPRELTASVQLALSSQDASEAVLAPVVSTQIEAASQVQRINLSAAARHDSVFGQSSPYGIADETVAGTVPVSLPFDLRYVETALQNGPKTITTAAPTVRRGYDRYGQVLEITDARNDGWKTRYTYNAAGQVLSQTKPNDTDPASITRATYDKHGNTASVTDARGNATASTYDNAGNLTAQQNADGGHIYNRFDAFGNKTETWVQTGTDATLHQYSITKYEYDLKGQLTATFRPDADIRIVREDANGYVTEQITGTEVEHWTAVEQSLTDVGIVVRANLVGTGGSKEQYSYDSLGRRTRTTLSASGAANGSIASESTHTDYDLQGQVVGEHSADGKTTLYAYDALGRKIYEREAAGRLLEWTYTDGSNRAATHKGLDAVMVKSTYNRTGELIAEHTDGDRVVDSAGTHAGLHRSYSYDSRGQLTHIVDTSRSGVTQHTSYAYDAAGNRVRERNEVQELGRNDDILQDNFLRYDAQGRLSEVADTRMKVNYSYDAVGNRTRMTASYRNDSDRPHQYDYAYTFDDMNRMLIEEGQLGQDGQVDITLQQGKRHSYDLAGRKISTNSWGLRAMRDHYEYRVGGIPDENGVTSEVLIVEDHYRVKTEKDLTVESYRYDAAGHLNAIERDGIEIQRRRYDLRGRLVMQETPQALADVFVPEDTTGGDTQQSPPATSGTRSAGQMLRDLGYAAQTTMLKYEVGSDRVSRQSVYQVGWDRNTSKEDGSVVANVAYQYDSAGNLRQSVSRSFVPYGGTTTTTNDWRALGDSDRQMRSASEGVTRGNVQHRYDGAGRLASLMQSHDDSASPDRKFYSDEAGRILQMRHINNNETLKAGMGTREQFVVVRGEQIARIGDDRIEANYKNEFGQVNAFSSQASVPRQATGARTYVVQAGDTLQKIAQAVYGDASLWYTIAEANGLTNGDAYHEDNNRHGIRAGQALTLPDPASVGAGSRSSADTLRPYDPTEAIGNTSPNLPPPPPKKGSFFGKLLMIVIAIVVTFYTAGTMSGFTGGFLQTLQAGMGAMTQGALGGALGSFVGGGLSASAVVGTAVAATAVGSFVSQAFGVAAGLQEEIDFKGIALSAFSAGITAGLGGANFGLGEPGNALARAAIGSTVTQGAAVVLGLQPSFSWRQVSAAVIAAPIAHAVGDAAAGVFGQFGPVAAPLVGSLVSGVTQQGIGKVLAGGKITATGVLQDAYGYLLSKGAVDHMLQAAQGQQGESLGNALGSSLTDAMGPQNTAQENFRQSEIHAQNEQAGRDAAYGYVNEMDRASDNFNPASLHGHRNGMDIASDAAAEQQRRDALYGWNTGHDGLGFKPFPGVGIPVLRHQGLRSDDTRILSDSNEPSPAGLGGIDADEPTKVAILQYLLNPANPLNPLNPATTAGGGGYRPIRPDGAGAPPPYDIVRDVPSGAPGSVQAKPSLGLGAPSKQADRPWFDSALEGMPISVRGTAALLGIFTNKISETIGIAPARGPDGRFVSSGEESSSYNRATQYPHDYRAGIREAVLDAKTLQSGPHAGKIKTDDGEYVSRDDPRITMEHNRAVVEHWNEIGYNSSRLDRVNFYNDLSNLSVRLKSANSSDGGKMSIEGIRFRSDVGPKYSR